jgi:uncharacterized protein (DUF849 family)
MNKEVFVTCALTGAGDTAGKSSYVPVTPDEIASDALEAAEAGAAIVHIHVRNPENGQASRDPALYREVVDRIRASNADLILNLTGGMGGDLWFDLDESAELSSASDFVGPLERVQHIIELCPEIGSLDCGSVNFGEMVYATTPNILREILKAYRRQLVRPEIEVFELGHIEIAKILIHEGLIDPPPLFQLCLGVVHGAPATPDAMKAMRDSLPPGSIWAGFGVGQMQMPMVAQAVLLGGHVRVGLEDNLYLEKGVLATNAKLVEKAVGLVQTLGGRILDATETRERLALRPAEKKTSAESA